MSGNAANYCFNTLLTETGRKVFASMGGFLFGYDTGQISGIQEMTDFINRFGTERDPATGAVMFNEWLIGVIVALLSVGTAIGCLIGAPLADHFGRRKAMFIETIGKATCLLSAHQ